MFVPPFPGSVRKFLKPDSAYHRQHGEIAAFLARRDGRPVGRIAAIANRSHNVYHRDQVGFFGFFNCVDEPEIAAALFAKASAWLRERGHDRIRGPYNPTINDDCGLMTQGFEIPPTVSMPWNPPYYENLVTSHSFEPVCEMAGFLLVFKEATMALAERIARRAKRQSRLTLRTLDLRNLERELRIFQQLYNATLERNWGFVPITLDDFLSSASDLKAFADPELALIAEDNGKPVGLAVALPDFNEILLRVKSTPGFLRLPHVALLMKTHRYQSCRFVLLGILPEYRKGGLLGWLFHELLEQARKSYLRTELSWIESGNTEVLQYAERMGGRRVRTYRIYEKSLG